MSYLYGDSTPSSLQVNFIEVLRDAIDFAAQVLQAEERERAGRARLEALSEATAANVLELENVGSVVATAIAGLPKREGEGPGARCAASIQRAAADLVRTEVASVRAALASEAERTEARAAEERVGCVKALEGLLLRHDLPGATVTLRLHMVDSARYACEARLTNEYQLSATIGLEVPGTHLCGAIVRVERLVDRLEIQAPEMGGWLHKEVKVRPQRLEKTYVTEVTLGEPENVLRLRHNPDGSGGGFDLTLRDQMPRVSLCRVGEGTAVAPFELSDADAAKVLAFHEKLAAQVQELGRRRKALLEATLGGEPLGNAGQAKRLVERLVEALTPTVREIAARSSRGELVLRRLLADDRREEIFVSKAELRRKLEGLSEDSRALFEPMWSDEPLPEPVRRPPPPPPMKARGRTSTPPLGSPLRGPVASGSDSTSAAVEAAVEE